jgi:hypothetical protein
MIMKDAALTVAAPPIDNRPVDGSPVFEEIAELTVRCRFNTTSGSVDFRGTLAENGNCAFHSVSGGLTLDLPEAPTARFNVETFSGNIHSTFGPQPTRKSEYGPGKAWRYQASSGASRFDIDTLSGDIRLNAPQP